MLSQEAVETSRNSVFERLTWAASSTAKLPERVVTTTVHVVARGHEERICVACADGCCDSVVCFNSKWGSLPVAQGYSQPPIRMVAKHVERAAPRDLQVSLRTAHSPVRILDYHHIVAHGQHCLEAALDIGAASVE